MSCSHPTSTTLAAIGVLLAAGSGASAGPEPYFGLSHTPLGGAVLTPGPGGGLVISNIGSSGNDGVSIDLGRTTGFAIQLDPGPGGALATGSMVCVTSTSTGGSLPHASMLEDGDGGAYLVLDSLGMLTPQCIHVQLRLRDDVVDEKEFPVSAAGTVLVSGPFGSSSGQPVTFELSSTAVDHAIEFFNPAPVLASISGSALGPVTCDEVAIKLNGLPPGEPVMGTLSVVISNPPGGTLPVYGEYMGVRPKGWDGTIKGNMRAMGDAQIAGIAGPDICAGCLECCEPPGGNPIDLFNGAIIDNLGSSGQDGVRFACRTWGSPWFVSDIDLRTSGIIIDDDDTLSLHAVGTFSGSPGHDLGECALRGDIMSGSTELLADFSAVGSSNVLVQVRDNGVPQGSVLLSGGPGVVLGNLYSGSGLPLEWTRCGKLGGVGETPCYVWGSEEHFIFISGPVALVGDDLRVLAISAAGPISEIESFTMLGKGLDSFIVTTRQDNDVANEIVYFAGLPHSPLGQAVLVADDSDGDDVPDLHVSNIGSSGQDGVSIDLGECEGARVSGALPRGNPHDICSISLDIYDDQCPMCPAGLVAGIEVTLVTPTSSTLHATRNHTLTGNVTLIKLSGEPPSQFTMPMTDELTITTDPGSSLRAVSMAAQARPGDPLTNEVLYALRCTLEEYPPNLADPGLTVSHSVHGTFHDVAEVVITTSESASPVGSIDRACIMAMTDPGSPLGEIRIERTGVVQHGHVHDALGDVALVSQECDDGDDDDDDDVIWAARTCCVNLGSKGQDGVAVDLRTHTCNDADSDCDGLPDDKVTGITVLLHEEMAPTELLRFRLTGTIDDGPEQELCSLERTCCPSPGHTTLLTTAPAFGGTPITRHVVVRDQFNNIVTQGDAPEPGPVATQSGDEPAENYTGSFTITVTALLTGETETVSFNYQKIEWSYDVLLQLPGQTFVSGRSLEVITEPSSGNPVTVNLDLDDFELLADPMPGEMMSIGLLEETIELYEPPCPGDLDGNGNVGFSDLTLLLINWGSCPASPTPCPADVDGNGNVGFSDLTTLLINWGPCDAS